MLHVDSCLPGNLDYLRLFLRPQLEISINFENSGGGNSCWEGESQSALPPPPPPPPPPKCSAQGSPIIVLFLSLLDFDAFLTPSEGGSDDEETIDVEEKQAERVMHVHVHVWPRSTVIAYTWNETLEWRYMFMYMYIHV